MNRKLPDAAICEKGGCESKATDIVYSRAAKKVLLCCSPCAGIIIAEATPEYEYKCKNCQCRAGIN